MTREGPTGPTQSRDRRSTAEHDPAYWSQLELPGVTGAWAAGAWAGVRRELGLTARDELISRPLRN